MQLKRNEEDRTIVQQYAGELVEQLKNNADIIGDLEHRSKKGQFRELFV